jgi:hypothetical protein
MYSFLIYKLSSFFHENWKIHPFHLFDKLTKARYKTLHKQIEIH